MSVSPFSCHHRERRGFYNDFRAEMSYYPTAPLASYQEFVANRNCKSSKHKIQISMSQNRCHVCVFLFTEHAVFLKQQERMLSRDSKTITTSCTKQPYIIHWLIPVLFSPSYLTQVSLMCETCECGSQCNFQLFFLLGMASVALIKRNTSYCGYAGVSTRSISMVLVSTPFHSFLQPIYVYVVNASWDYSNDPSLPLFVHLNIFYGEHLLIWPQPPFFRCSILPQVFFHKDWDQQLFYFVFFWYITVRT